MLAFLLIYPEADFEVFRPKGAKSCTDGVKFDTEEGTFGPLLRVKFQLWGSYTLTVALMAMKFGMESVPSSVPNFTPIGATTRV